MASVLKLIFYILVGIVLFALALKLLGFALVLVGWLIRVACVAFVIYLVVLLVKQVAKA